MRTLISSSFRDPAGFLFLDDSTLYRQVNHFYRQDYDRLNSSGFYGRLIDAGYLIPHQEVEIQPFTNDAYKILIPQELRFISYPYEWSFSQLEAAALLTLEIQRLALENDFTLKDASAYNVQFLQGKPIFIDTLSFERLIENQPWTAYKQFCQHFLAPLALMAKTDISLTQLLRTNIDGIPLKLASTLLPFSTKLNFGLGIHIHLHSRSQQKYADNPSRQRKLKGKFSKTSFLALIDSLKSSIMRLNWSATGTEWHDYYDANNNYFNDSLSVKENIVETMLQKVSPGLTWDLGANTGRFSQIAAKYSEFVCAWDIDPACVEKNYQESKANKITNLLPLLVDLTNPSPAIGWNNDERMSLLDRGPVDMVLALGLIHHLAITHNLSFIKIADFLHELTSGLIIEFVPKQDSQVQKLLASRNDIFTHYSKDDFEDAFSHYFVLESCQPISGSERIIYLFSS